MEDEKRNLEDELLRLKEKKGLVPGVLFFVGVGFRWDSFLNYQKPKLLQGWGMLTFPWLSVLCSFFVPIQALNFFIFPQKGYFLIGYPSRVYFIYISLYIYFSSFFLFFFFFSLLLVRVNCFFFVSS